jgi:hypothetical protein
MMMMMCVVRGRMKPNETKYGTRGNDISSSEIIPNRQQACGEVGGLLASLIDGSNDRTID